MSERFVMLTVERDGRTLVMDGRWKAKEGDLIAVAIHVPEHEEAIHELELQGWLPAPEADAEEPDEAPDADREGASGAGAPAPANA